MPKKAPTCNVSGVVVFLITALVILAMVLLVRYVTPESIVKVSKCGKQTVVFEHKAPTPPRDIEPAVPYKQIGILVSKDGEEPPVILPLFGRKMQGRDRYEYYTATDKEHLWQIPVQFEKRDCQDRLGCEEVYDGSDVVVPDYANKTFRARIYRNSGAALRSDI